MKITRIIGIALSLIVLGASPVAARAATVGDVAEGLVCQCGCTMILSSCSHIECGSRDAMTTLIGQKLDQGETPAQITGYFVTQYGEQVLSSPPKRGFNLTAWVLPFAALLFGAWVVYVALRKWLGRGRYSQAAAVAIEKGDAKYRRRLEKELADFSDRGFR
ncbi:cytochrome c-type biogenesis protein CcmH [Chloroflexota bacterium]